MKLDIAQKNRTYHVELEADKSKNLFGKKIGEEFEGSIIDSKFDGFKLKITGLSDKSGFCAREDVEGTSLQRVLLTKGVGMSGKRSKKKKKIDGLRLKKTIRGNTIAKDIHQVNMKVLDASGKDLAKVLGKEEVAAENSENKEKENTETTTQANKEEKVVEKKEE